MYTLVAVKLPEKVIGWHVFLDSNTRVLKLDKPNSMSMVLTRKHLEQTVTMPKTLPVELELP